MLNSTERQELSDYTESAYLNYSMYVILDRALPQVADGLKPVQRRIVYAMSELGLNAAAKYKKSARTVGDVLGKFHPHGDSACYEAMVLMAQPFSYRYPLVDGQGNWGAADDPKSFAAMRYTESKLTKYSSLMLSELSKGTVDFQPNFDGTLKEPVTLPAQVPNILLNSVMGIAVGMATDIPPHNLKEVIAGTIAILNGEVADVSGLMEYIKAPDYPTGCEVVSSKHELKAMYETGRGSVKCRAIYEIEDTNIVITALPFQSSGNKIIEQIAEQMTAKKLPQVVDLRDESDHETPTRIVIELKSKRVDAEPIISHLFATTDLEKSYRVNMNMIGLDGNPAVKNLFEIVNEWLSFRKETVLRRLNFELAKVQKRIHILDGLIIAFLNLDEVIRIIREEEHPKQALMEAFNLSEVQADAILETKLRHLAKLEENKLRAENDDLKKEEKRLSSIIDSKAKLKKLIQTELQTISDEFGDDRRCKVVERVAAKAISKEDMLSNEPVTIMLSKKGWVKSGKGHSLNTEGTAFKTGDQLVETIELRNNQSVVALGSTGRAYTFSAHELPSMKSAGEPLSGKLSPANGERFKFLLNPNDEELNYLYASDSGNGFRGNATGLISRVKAGKAHLSLKNEENPLRPVEYKELPEYCLCVSTSGRMLVFPAIDIPELGKGKGNKLMNIPTANLEQGERICAVKLFNQTDKIIIFSGKRKLTLNFNDIQSYIGKRARRGVSLPRGFTNVDSVEIS